MNSDCLPGVLAVGLVAIGVACWSFLATVVLKGKIEENARLRAQREELIASWQMILDPGLKEKGE